MTLNPVSAAPSVSPSALVGGASLQQRFAATLEAELAQARVGGAHQALLRAAARACRTELAQRWTQTQQADATPQGMQRSRRVHYLSMEFLMGRALGNALAALDLTGTVQQHLPEGTPSISAVLEQESDAALGNGGLGRLAACFLDSFAELGLPSFGYGLRYQYGMFAQRIQDGRQVEVPDDWLRLGNDWELERPEVRYSVGFGGHVTVEGGVRRWVPAQRVVAHAYDFVVPAHHSARVSTLRQWHASAEQGLDFAAFCHGDYMGAARHKVAADALNWVLYPDDSTAQGRELRLKQEAFLVSASLQDVLARHLREAGSLQGLAKRNAIHLNDTHPALAPAEWMRLLLDEQGLGWDEAWALTRQCVSYTNHTLMPEALETWDLELFGRLLPRHLEIIYEINHRFLAEVRARCPGEDALLARVSIIDEAGSRRVRMAALAIIASHKVNGVSALHSDLMVQTIFADYARLFPERFFNVTNGVTPRRWLMQANAGLSALIDTQLGTGWRRNLDQLSGLKARAAQPALGQAFLHVKRQNKERLAALIRRELGISVNVDSLFDVQIKRIHEYKRQLLNVLHVVARYQAICDNPTGPWVPRTVIIAGKAASAYQAAKSIIALIHDVARVVNTDPRVGDKLKLVFLPNYGVSLAETILPAADLSEQISTAGTEASGTGNMKFALNGALTIGTWDGANIEMAQAMGEDNMFVFGLRTQAVQQLKSLGYDPRLYVEENRQLRRVIDAIASGTFSAGEPQRYQALVDGLLQRDPYLLMADFAAYVNMQHQVDALYATPAAWAERAWLNVAAMGWFSSDRTIAEYVRHVWTA